MSTEILNDAEFLYYYELIDGKKFRLPSMTPAQNQIKGRVMLCIGKYLMDNKRGYFFSNVEVHFDEKNIFVPDLIVVLKENESILAKGDFVRGAPDMLVEVLSKSTRKNDLTIKKDAYEQSGVKEYWIIDPYMKSISVYLFSTMNIFFLMRKILKKRNFSKVKVRKLKLSMKFLLKSLKV